MFHPFRCCCRYPGMPMYEELKHYIEVHDLKKWIFTSRCSHQASDQEQLGALAVWANQEFYGKKNRVERVLASPVLHPFSKAIFQSYMAGMEEYAQKASGKQVA